jgi:prephenate dehydratase
MSELTVAFQGERGAFSESAARRLLGSEVTLRPCETFDDMFEAVRATDADCCERRSEPFSRGGAETRRRFD